MTNIMRNAITSHNLKVYCILLTVDRVLTFYPLQEFPYDWEPAETTPVVKSVKVIFDR